MFSKSQRLTRQAFTTTRKRGVTLTHPLFSVFIGASPDLINHYSVVVSTKISKKAVVRNKIRRLFYNAFEIVSPHILSHKSYIVYVRTPILKTNLKELCEIIKSLIVFQKH